MDDAKRQKEVEEARKKLRNAEKQRAEKQKNLKDCNFCFELINKKAIVCKHCHTDLVYDEDHAKRIIKNVDQADGMGVAKIVMVLGYICVALSIILLLLLQVSSAVTLFGSGLSLVLLSYVATATIRTSEYTKIILLKQRDYRG